MNYYKELVLVIMEAGKSPNPPFASWRFKKTSGVVQSNSKDLRTTGIDGEVPNLRGEEV